MSASDSVQRSVLADLCVFAVGHEIAAIRLCGQAALQCTDRTGQMLLVDMALDRIEELSQLELSQEGLGVTLPRLEPAELERLLALRHHRARPAGPTGRRRQPHPRPSLRRLRMVGELLAALGQFDAQAELVLRSMAGLLPTGPARTQAHALEHAKGRWLRLNEEVHQYLITLGPQAHRSQRPARAAGSGAEPR